MPANNNNKKFISQRFSFSSLLCHNNYYTSAAATAAVALDANAIFVVKHRHRLYLIKSFAITFFYATNKDVHTECSTSSTYKV